MSPSHLEGIARFVPADTLADSGLVFRRPIGEWARQLTVRLRSCSGQKLEPEAIDRGCSAINNAALVFVHAGFPGIAEEICKSQLNWIESCRGAISPDPSLFAIQPWINLGRLCRRSRNYSEALRYFLALDTSRQRTTVRFGEWEASITKPFREAAEPIYVYEIMRTHLQSGDFARTVEFANNLTEPLLTSSFMLRTELLLHAFLHSDEPHRLLPLLKEMPWPENQFGVLARHLYMSLALGAIGQTQSCTKALERMEPHVVSYISRLDLDSQDLRLAFEVCRLAKSCDVSEVFAALLQAACVAVLRVRDVPLASQLLGLLDEQEYVMATEGMRAVQDFVLHSGYAIRFSRPRFPELSEALMKLRHAVSDLLCSPVRELCA